MPVLSYNLKQVFLKYVEEAKVLAALYFYFAQEHH